MVTTSEWRQGAFISPFETKSMRIWPLLTDNGVERMPRRHVAVTRANAMFAVLSLECLTLTGCSGGGAPSFDLFGAFFPAWLLCGVIGIAGAVVARVVFVGTGLANTLPYQLAVCTAIGVIAALLVWLVGFGH